MRFRPCIDIHNGAVKQIVGGTLLDAGSQAEENFVSHQNGDYYADFYRSLGLSGGHIILLNPESSEFYGQDVRQAELALKAYPGGFQLGGGIHPENASKFLNMGASHVIVTSYVFRNGVIHYEHLRRMVQSVGRKRLVLDLSCRKRNGAYYVVTNRWQAFTDVRITEQLLDELSSCCDEFLIHGVDVEGKTSGIETELAALLGQWNQRPVTYAGGVSSLQDLELLRRLGQNHVDVTIGSALDLFGGHLPFRQVLNFINQLR